MSFVEQTETERLVRGIGRWLRGLRMLRGMSVETLASQASMTTARIEHIELGVGPVIDLAELTAVMAAIDANLMDRLVEFVTAVGAASERPSEVGELSRLASRMVTAFGGVPSPATRNAVAELMEAVAGYGGGRRLDA